MKLCLPTLLMAFAFIAMPSFAQDGIDCDNLPQSNGLEPPEFIEACGPSIVEVEAVATGPTDMAFGYQAGGFGEEPEEAFYSYTLNDPANTTFEVAAVSPDAELLNGCDFDDSGDFSTAICASFVGLIFSVDMTIGAATSIGPSGIPNGISDITYDPIGETWYALETDCSTVSNLWTIDPGTGAGTMVGSGTAMTCGIAIGADNKGDLYAYSITEDELVSVDKTTGDQTVIGPLGHDAAFAQSMDCDSDDGTCYAFAYFGGGANGLLQLDKSTGAGTSLGNLGTGNEYSAGMVATVISSSNAPLLDGTPDTHVLTSAYPNPFNPSSQFELTVAQRQHVSAALYNTLGQRVATLFSGTVDANQSQQVTIDGKSLASGLYTVRVQGEHFTDALRVTLMK